jgi:hypothetical protein
MISDTWQMVSAPGKPGIVMWEMEEMVLLSYTNDSRIYEYLCIPMARYGLGTDQLVTVVRLSQ